MLLSVQLPQGMIGQIMLELIRTVPDWPKPEEESVAEAVRDRSRLSPAELGVLICSAEGLSTDETAARLLKSPHTVIRQRRTIFEKLDVHSMTEAVGVAIARGLIEAPRVHPSTQNGQDGRKI